MEGAIRCSASYAPLTPISFLERAAIVYGDRTAIAFGSKTYTWREVRDRCLKIASALVGLGVSRHDVVAIFAPNVPATYELQFAIPMAGATICTLNTHQDATSLSLLLGHAEPKILFVDHDLIEKTNKALMLLGNLDFKPPILIEINQFEVEVELQNLVEPINPSVRPELNYDTLMQSESSEFEIKWPIDEFDPISISYTSGTTARPKGVIYTHRGAYLNAVSTLLLTEMTSMPVYLWTVPMFHCNGWCLAWGVAAQGGTNICTREVSAKGIFEKVAMHKVSHMGGAPALLNMIINALEEEIRPLPRKVGVLTGGASPPPHVLSKMEELGFDVTHAYGMSETYGAATVCTWNPEWDPLPVEERARIKARHGVHHIGLEMDVKDPSTLKSVQANNKDIGEVMLRGNTVMAGYYKDPSMTSQAMAGGWYRADDLAVKQSDGYIQVLDRSKDIIISGDHTISSIEVEAIIFDHPFVLEVAVVARPDERYGEVPLAFVKLKKGCRATSDDILSFCAGRLPNYMVPNDVVFVEELPKTSTGKTQKYVLRKIAQTME